jgi:hypothetical protein
MGAFDLLAKAASKGAKKAAPFFSKADVVLDELQRGKGAGNEFLGELVKKGAKPTELRERGIEKALKDKPKMTKAEVQKIFESNPPPRVQEKVLSSEVTDYDEWLDAKALELYGDEYSALSRAEQSKLNKMYGDLPLTQYDRYKTPGGENYREILLKLPNQEKQITDADIEDWFKKSFDMDIADDAGPDWRSSREDFITAMREENPPTEFISDHFKAEPNILAHIRVQDFQLPSKGFAVVNTRSGFRSEVFPTMEQAQAALVQYPENLQTMLKVTEAQGKPKKVLLVDEIQSDWHQAGRKKGYKSGDEEEKIWNLTEQYNNLMYRRKNLIKEAEATNNTGIAFIRMMDEIGDITPQIMKLQKQMDDLREASSSGVPDAPFKKNWHELAMKRVLDYAAEHGYDSVAITPGAEQAKRYDLSKQLDRVIYSPYDDGTFEVSAMLPDGREFSQVAGRKTVQEIEDTFGKEIAQKMARGEKTGEESGVSFLSGEGLQVGGEGMKGFYDKILPDYLNNYGKKYGAQMGEINLQTPNMDSWNLEDSARFHGMSGADYLDSPNRPQLEKQFLESRKNQTSGFHSFDITPQMREEIRTKGQPMYGKVATPVLEGLAAGSGAATIGSEVFDTNNEQQVQNPVHFTENPDAMLLELMQRN